MTINNGTITDVIKGTQAFDEVYHGNVLVFERYLPHGTVLWSGDTNSSNKATQTLTLTTTIEKLKGIVIYFGPSSRIYDNILKYSNNSSVNIATNAAGIAIERDALLAGTAKISTDLTGEIWSGKQGIDDGTGYFYKLRKLKVTLTSETSVTLSGTQLKLNLNLARTRDDWDTMQGGSFMYTGTLRAQITKIEAY